jgi:hypothetical protein
LTEEAPISCGDKFKYTLKRLWETITSDIKYIYLSIAFGVTSFMSVLFITCLEEWVIAFGPSNEQSAREVYTSLMKTTAVICLPLVFIFGYMSDKVQPFISLPSLFLLRGIMSAVFCFYDFGIPDGRTPGIYVVVAFMMVFTLGLATAINAMFMRTLPSDIRGTMLGFLMTVSQLVLAIFVKTIQQYDDSKKPFNIVLWADFSMAVVSMILAIIGQLRFRKIEDKKYKYDLKSPALIK